MARSRKKADEQDTSFNPAEFDPSLQEKPPEALPVAVPVEDGPEDVKRATAFNATPSSTTRDPAHVGGAVNQVLQKAREQLGHMPQTNKPEGAKLADPHFFEMISLTDKNDGPKIHLGRSNRNRDMLIKFDVKPEGDIAEAAFTIMKENGFRWNRDAQAWTAKIGNEQKWRAHQDAEKVFHVVGNMLREANGLGPVTNMSMTA